MSSDLTAFSTVEFDANEYANAVLAAEPHPTPVVISKLSFAIEDASKQIKNLVATHHESLLAQASNVTQLSGSLNSVKSGLDDLESSLEKLRLKIRVPYQSMQEYLSRLQKLQEASEVLRRASRFVVLARRLQLQMQEVENITDVAPNKLLSKNAFDSEGEKERAIATAALSIAELASLAGPLTSKQASSEKATQEATSVISLRSINAIAAYIPFVEEARVKVTAQMESMVFTGLATLDQSLLALSLQAAYNLRILPSLVKNLIIDLSQAVDERIKTAFDISKISKEALSKEPTTPPLTYSPHTAYRSRVRTEPTSVTAPQFTVALWSRLEVMIEELADCCIKVYTLEKVLKLKKDAVTDVVFLDEVMKSLENKPSATFWQSLGQAIEKHAKDATKNSTFLQQTLGSGYPKLLRLFQEFFTKVALHSDTVYSESHQSPEAIFILRSIASFESIYLAKSSNKLNEAIAQAFSGGIRAPPGYNEGINIARATANELDSARFDPVLVRSVGKNAIASIDMFLSRTDGMIVRDRSATTLTGPTATPQQVSNGQLATCLYQCWHRFEKLKSEVSDTSFIPLQQSIQKIYKAYEGVVEPVKAAIRRELGAIIAKLHRIIDFGKNEDSTAGMGGPSLYIKELVDKLSFVRTEIFDKFSIGEAGRTWLQDIVRFVMRTFVLHVSIARPLTESGKLQFTSDMTELEFGLSAFTVDNSQSKRGGNLDAIGDDYKALRALR